MSQQSTIEKIETKEADSTLRSKHSELTKQFLDNLLEEKKWLPEEFPLCAIIIDDAVDRIFSIGKIPGREFYADVLKQKPLKISQKVLLPVKQYPKFNFIGRLLGPKGNTLRRLQEEAQCKIAIKGRNSMRDTAKEEELRTSANPKYSHLHKNLYLEISAFASPAECYARIAYVLTEIRKYIIPDKNDEISQEQLREMLEINPESSKSLRGDKSYIFKSVLNRDALLSNISTKHLNLKKTDYKYQEEDSESVLGRKSPVSSGATMYIDLVRKTAKHPQTEGHSSEHKPEGVVYKTPKQNGVKQPITCGTDDAHSSSSAQKRSQPTIYVPEIKRLRETPSTPNKKNPYDILKKYRLNNIIEK